jgi:FixJ family two-component response regulator
MASVSESVVYVVDDNESARQSLTWLIESVGLKVRAFPSAQQFLDACDTSLVGCLVLDMRMPGMSGLELQERLCELGYTMPVIFITAFGELQAAVLAMKRGAIDFIEKPYDSEQLLAQIQKALRDHALRAGIEARIALLTQREKQVLDLVSRGGASYNIAEQLGLSQKTIEAHRTSIMKKMQVRSVSELISVYLHTIRHGSVLNN